MNPAHPDNSYEHEEYLDGASCGVFHCSDDGAKITLAGWTYNRLRFKAGDRILLHASKGQVTRYKITETKFPSAPTDMFFLYCEFDPRHDTQPPAAYPHCGHKTPIE